MAQAGYTPISLYHSTTAAVVPIAGNLVPGELAINIADGKLYFENSSGVVTLLASSTNAGGTFAAPVVIEGTTTDAALRITQLGTGNALLVEDSTNPDASPFVIDATGNVGIGTSTPSSYAFGLAIDNTNATNTGYVFNLLSSGSSWFKVGRLAASSTAIIQSGQNLSLQPDSGNVGIGTSSPTAMLQVAGNSSTSALKVPNIEEVATVSATAATGTIAYDITTQSVLFYTSNATANWTVNFRGSSGTSLNTLMQTGESISVTFLVTQGTTAYYNSAVQIDGTTSGVTTRWQGGTAPTSGNASSLDSYTYVIIKTASATYTVLAAQTRFA